MNTNEQTEKTLGQIAYEAQGSAHQIPWYNLTPINHRLWTESASAVEQAVLERMGLVSVEAEAEPQSEFLSHEELRFRCGGQDPHRLDGWKCEWLVNGWRPLLPDEIPQGNSMYEWNGGFQKEAWRTCDNSWFGVKAKHAAPNSFFRTKAPLPPTTEQKPDGEAQRACESPSPASPPAGTGVPPSRWSKFSREELESVAEGYGNHIPSLEAEIAKLKGLVSHVSHDRALQGDQITTLTKERDEAIEKSRIHTNHANIWSEEADSAKSRAEQAEKKLAEAEAFAEQMRKLAEEAQLSCNYKCVEIGKLKDRLADSEMELKSRTDAIDSLLSTKRALEWKLAEMEKWNQSIDERNLKIQSLEQKLSRFRWVPVSERMPTKEDAPNGWVWVWKGVNEVPAHPIVEVHYSQVGGGFWMTPIQPLPTPPEKQETAEDFLRILLKNPNNPEWISKAIKFLAGAASTKETK
jgi:hypothetical protein